MRWPKACLGDVAQIVSGATPKSSVDHYWDGDIPWITPADLSKLEGKEVSATSRRITEAGLASCSARLLPPKSVLFSSRAPIGHVAINTVPMATNQGFKSFVPDQGILSSDFLYWWLKTNKTYLQSLGRGATFKEVSKEIVESIELPLPPLEEQRRIAALLDKRSCLEQKIRRRDSLQEDLWKAEFIKRFGNPFSHQSPYRQAKIAEIASTSSGGTPRREERSYFGGSIPWVKSGELSNPIVEATEEFLTEDGLANSSAKMLNPGVVLLAMYGATAGAVSILGIPASTNQAICAIDAHGRLDSIYLADYLRLITPALLAKRIGGAQPNLTQDIIRNILIPVPCEESQRSYVFFRKQLANIGAAFSGSLMAVSRLSASFSQQVFALDSGLQ